MKSEKVLVAEVVHENGFIPVSFFFSLLRKILRLFRCIPLEEKHFPRVTHRLISPNAFFTNGFLDVSFLEQAAINQVFRIKGIEGKWLLMRKIPVAELQEEVIRKANKLNEGKIRSIDRLLEEEYPHLFVDKRENQAEIEILEVLELD